MKRVLTQAAAAAAAVAVLIGAGEWAFRSVPRIMLPEWELRRHHDQLDSYGLDSVPDSDVGFLPRPNQQARIRTDDFDYLLRTDSRGFANAQPRASAADVVVLGDSLVEGEGVDLELGFPALLGQRLSGARVVNLAVTAAGPERQNRIYRRFGRELHPRLVIAGLYLASDLENDETFNAWLREGRGSQYEKFRRHGGGEAPAAKKRETLRRWLQRESWLYGNVLERLRRMVGRSRPPREVYRFPSGEEVLFDSKALAFALNRGDGSTPRVEAATRSVARLKAVVEDGGARLIVVLIPSKEELFASGVGPSGPPEVVELRRRLAESGVEVLDLYPSLRSAGGRAAPYFRRNIHLSRFGHAVVADEISSYLQEKPR